MAGCSRPCSVAVSKATALQAFADLTKKIPGHPVVTAQELDRQLEKFHLIDDGDNTEQHLWLLLLRDDFPNYELFWRKYVVPVTFRLRSDLPHEKRIRLRPAAKYFEP